jgi:hypothetical protein
VKPETLETMSPRTGLAPQELVALGAYPMHQHTRNRISVACAGLVVVALGFIAGAVIGDSTFRESDSVRILRIGAALERAGATVPKFEHVAALVDAGRIEEAEAIAKEMEGGQ